MVPETLNPEQNRSNSRIVLIYAVDRIARRSDALLVNAIKEFEKTRDESAFRLAMAGVRSFRDAAILVGAKKGCTL